MGDCFLCKEKFRLYNCIHTLIHCMINIFMKKDYERMPRMVTGLSQKDNGCFFFFFLLYLQNILCGWYVTLKNTLLSYSCCGSEARHVSCRNGNQGPCAQGLTRLQSRCWLLGWGRNHFQAHSGCWQSSTEGLSLGGCHLGSARKSWKLLLSQPNKTIYLLLHLKRSEYLNILFTGEAVEDQSLFRC